MTVSQYLDRRVAEVLGWGITLDGSWVPPGSAGNYQSEPPPYSTEFGPWTQEMLDWLIGFGSVRAHASKSRVRLYLDGSSMEEIGGRNYPEAIARLVIAVAEREEQSRG